MYSWMKFYHMRRCHSIKYLLFKFNQKFNDINILYFIDKTKNQIKKIFYFPSRDFA